MTLDEYDGAVAVHLFIRVADIHQVAVELYAGAFDRDQGHQLNDAMPLHVDGAAAVDIPVFHQTLEGGNGPLAVGYRYHIHVVHQSERLLLPVAFEAGVKIGPSGSQLRRVEDLPIDSFPGQHLLQPTRRGQLVARRVRCVDRDVLGEQLHRLISEPVIVERSGLRWNGDRRRKSGKPDRCSTYADANHGARLRVWSENAIR